MTYYYANAEIPDGLGYRYQVRAFWDKHNGHGVDVILVGPDTTTQWEEPTYIDGHEAALIRFTTAVKRITKAVYG